MEWNFHPVRNQMCVVSCITMVLGLYDNYLDYLWSESIFWPRALAYVSFIKVWGVYDSYLVPYEDVVK